jgi:hypothetical protein
LDHDGVYDAGYEKLPRIGPDPSDAFAAPFHAGLEQYIRGQSKALYANLRGAMPDPGHPTPGPDDVWNHAVWKYEATYEEADGGDEHFIRVTIDIHANDDHTPPTDDSANRDIEYVYAITYANGLPVGSGNDDWQTVGKPEGGNRGALYPPRKLSYISGATWGGSDPYVTEDRVRGLDSAN